jgi:hypothetical protein
MHSIAFVSLNYPSLTNSHALVRFSFQRLTFPSVQLNTSILLASDQETCQATKGNLPPMNNVAAARSWHKANGDKAYSTGQKAHACQ